LRYSPIHLVPTNCPTRIVREPRFSNDPEFFDFTTTPVLPCQTVVPQGYGLLFRSTKIIKWYQVEPVVRTNCSNNLIAVHCSRTCHRTLAALCACRRPHRQTKRRESPPTHPWKARKKRRRRRPIRRRTCRRMAEMDQVTCT
jgi:hypothetical protein